MPEPTEVSRRIAEYIAALIPNGSTLELGIRRIPIAVLEFLKDKRYLGIHTEVFRNNKAMQAVFAKSGCKIRSSIEDRVYSFELHFA